VESLAVWAKGLSRPVGKDPCAVGSGEVTSFPSCPSICATCFSRLESGVIVVLIARHLPFIVLPSIPSARYVLSHI